jgi:signal transduction histidine kinase
LLNAIQAMPNGGTLTVCAAPAGDHVRLTISDTGVGITRDNLQKIFSPFFTTKHRGTGLGLAITRTIVEKHHGIITVESECGRGTTFTLEFAACTPAECGAPLEVTGHGTN